VILAPGQLLVQPDAGFSLITDLVASEGLIRLPREATETVNSGAFRYRLQSVGEPPRYRGYLKETPPEATITGALEMVAEASSIRITADWLVTPQGSLRGQLPIENVGDQGQLLYELIGSRELGQSESGQSESGQSEQAARVTSWKVTVNGQPAVIRPASGGELRAGISAIYSEQLASQPCQIRLLGSLPLRLAEATLENKNPRVRAELRLPRPALPSGSWQPDLGLRTVESPGLSLLVSGAEQAADEPLDLSGNGAVMVTLESRVDELVRAPVIERALMRSELGRGRRFDRLLANVSGGSPSFRVEFAASFDDALSGPQAADQPVVRIFLDGEERFDFEQSASGLEIPFEPASESRMIDIRVWSAHDGSGPATAVRPRLRLPISTGKTYWDVVLAPDRHLVWSMSGASELMVWRYDRLFVRRVPIRSYADLLNWMGADSPAETQAGNRYLLVTSDPGALEFYESGRPLLWLTIASIVLGATAFLLYYPVLRHPIVAVVAGCLLAGLAWIAPDLAVIAGQLVIVAMLLVAVMMGTRAILTRRPRATVLGGLADGSSVRSAAARRNSGSNVEPKTTQIQEAVPSGSAAGVQS
jgi:multisubunit Na+/H+ antiporter MnhB subunit